MEVSAVEVNFFRCNSCHTARRHSFARPFIGPTHPRRPPTCTHSYIIFHCIEAHHQALMYHYSSSHALINIVIPCRVSYHTGHVHPARSAMFINFLGFLLGSPSHLHWVLGSNMHTTWAYTIHANFTTTRRRKRLCISFLLPSFCVVPYVTAVQTHHTLIPHKHQRPHHTTSNMHASKSL